MAGSRAERQALIEAAQASIALRGLSNLKAREIASKAGCHGSISGPAIPFRAGPA
jgi:DNA-binding transcriptional regulator YbjK